MRTRRPSAAPQDTLADTRGSRRRLLVGAGLALVLVAGVVAGCGATRRRRVPRPPGARAERSPCTAGSTSRRSARSRRTSRRRTGITVALRSGGEGELANQIIQEGSNSPADVFYAGNSPALKSLAGKDLLAPVEPADARGDPGQGQLARRRLDGRLGAPVGARLQHVEAVERRPPGVAARPRRSRLEGQDRLRAHRDRLPAARDRRDPGQGRGGGRGVAARPEGQRRPLRGQRGDHRRGQSRRRRRRPGRALLLVPSPRRAGRRGDQLRAALLRRGRSRRARRGIGRRHPGVIGPRCGRAGVPPVPREHAGAGDHREQ